MGHLANSCTRRIRCRYCFKYGHKQKNCHEWIAKRSSVWVPKTAKDTACLESCAVPLPSLDSTTSSEKTPVEYETAPTSSPPPPPLPSPKLLLPSCMANFELDPAPWTPAGHEIIDGGPTRLPRTFYSPAVAPPRRHGSWCVGMLMPPQPAEEIPMWRQMVRNYIVNVQRRAVEDFQPALFGLDCMSSVVRLPVKL